MENQKVDKDIAKNLNSADRVKQKEAIEFVRAEGSSGYLPLLANLYVTSNNLDVKGCISAVFQDVKDVKSAGVIISLLKGTSSDDLRSMLLTACWSSSLDFSSFLFDLVEVALNHEFMVVFEVVTVVENFETIPPNDQIERSLSCLRAYTCSSPEKDELIQELIHCLELY